MTQLTMLFLTVAMVLSAMATLVLSALAVQHRHDQGSGIDPFRRWWTRELYRPSRYTPRGRRYLYGAWAANIIAVALALLVMSQVTHQGTSVFPGIT